MSETVELIVEFQPGVSEEDARTLVTGTGAKIRRRMKGDSDEHLMLLVRYDGSDAASGQSRLEKDKAVKRIEVNRKDYGIL